MTFFLKLQMETIKYKTGCYENDHGKVSTCQKKRVFKRTIKNKVRNVTRICTSSLCHPIPFGRSSKGDFKGNHLIPILTGTLEGLGTERSRS